MEAAIGIGAARWAVGRALGPITSGLLEPWAASSALGTKIHELKMELLYAQGMLNNARAGRDVRNPALAQLLLELRQLAYLADDVLDELEYFRIQDELKGTFQTMDPEGLKGLLVHAQHTVKSHARKLKPPLCLWPTACHGDKEHEDGKQGCLSRACAHGGCMPKVIASSIRAVGNRLPCSHSRMSMQDDASDASNMPPMHGRRLPCAYKAQFPALKLDRLFLENNSGLERFTKAQEKALHMLTSLQELEISFFSKLQSGPAGLSGELHSLKKLRFWRCEKLQSLPKDSIPTSLEVLSINHCPQLRSVPKDGLENSSLRGLVLSDVSDELEKQCRKLQGTIPVYREEH
ncbi:hypothetical protein ACQ4PT_010685 [Festuca glaucescens]